MNDHLNHLGHEGAPGTFRLVAVDETGYCNERILRDLTDPDGGAVTVYGIYLVKEGEATHVCSLTPSSYAEIVDYAVCGASMADDAAIEAADDFRMSCLNDSEPGTYFAFEFWQRHPHSAPFEADDWEDAREHANTNPPNIGGIYP